MLLEDFLLFKRSWAFVGGLYWLHVWFLGTPQIIEELRGKDIVKIGVGKNLSVFLTAKGQVLTCGIQDLTALSETECKLNRPCPVQGLDDIVDISVGAEHVLVLNKKGQVYGWGNNFSSQLGLDPDVHGDLVTKPNLIPGNYFVFFKAKIIYRTRAIISRGLYMFYPIFHCSL